MVLIKYLNNLVIQLIINHQVEHLSGPRWKPLAKVVWVCVRLKGIYVFQITIIQLLYWATRSTCDIALLPQQL